ncbi:MAG: methionyl-tRNA formyltransferase [Dehalococcoidia bacterium]|nr:methionyl-tRNA formyltransferase [Dehalococcoidia bacterium]
MKVSVIGQAAFGEAVLKRLLQDGVTVSAVSAPDTPGARPDPLWAAAEAAGLPRVPTAALKTPEGIAGWRPLAGDLCLMAFVTEILPEELFAMAAKGTVQYHPSLLPLHRGSSAINWAIINGDRETGITIFWPDDGIDTGPVLIQRAVPIGPDDTVASLYFNSLFPMGVEAMAESVALVASGQAPRIAQDHGRSTYEPPCRDGHAAIRWYRPADALYALIRGCNPQPGAWTTFAEGKVRIFDCRLTGALEPGMPGRILRVDDDGFDVRLNGGVLRVTRVQPDGGKKMPAAEWARAVNLQPGSRFT